MAKATLDATASPIPNFDILDGLTTSLAQLEAMLLVICGDGGESFRRYNDDIQDNYLSSCIEKVKACRRAAESPFNGRGVSCLN